MKKLFILSILFIGLTLSALNLGKTTGTIIEQEYKKIGATYENFIDFFRVYIRDKLSRY